jgi:phospholipase/carboxylesterase
MALVTNVVKGSDAERVLLLMHGYGADERDLGGLLPYLDPEGKFVTVLPRGPLAAPPGFSWFDVMASDPEEKLEGFASALTALDDLLDEMCAEHSMKREEAVVAGFSQGGALAFALGLGRNDRPHPAGVLAMSPFVRLELLDVDWEAAKQIPVLLQHGTDDPMVKVASSRELAALLVEHGVPVVYGEYPMGHEVAAPGSTRSGRASGRPSRCRPLRPRAPCRRSPRPSSTPRCSAPTCR